MLALRGSFAALEVAVVCLTWGSTVAYDFSENEILNMLCEFTARATLTDVRFCFESSELEFIIKELVKQRALEQPLPIGVVTFVLYKMNNILQNKQSLNNSGSLLRSLDMLGTVVEFPKSQSGTKIVKSNIALLVGKATADKPLWGFKMYAQNGSPFTFDSFEIMRKPYDSSIQDANITDVMVVFPSSVAHNAIRISFVAFRNDVAFRSLPNDRRFVLVNSHVVSVTIQNLNQLENDQVIEIYFKPIRENISRNVSRACAYWEFSAEDNNTGYWSQEGCTIIRATHPGALDTCRCNHLTHFAEILVPRTVFSEENERVLEIISVVGCCLSIFGLTIIALTAVLFRTWRQNFLNKVWLQLCFSVSLKLICFLIIAFSRFDHYNNFCMIVGIVLHCSVLCSFCWMLVAAVLSYRRLVLVFTLDPSHKLLKVSAFSYGAPVVLVGVLLAIDYQSYQRDFEDTSLLKSFCYPTGLGLWLTVRAPVGMILLVNWTLFILIIRSVFCSKKVERHGESNETLRCITVCSLLVFLFGLPTITGFFIFNLVIAYVYVITATLQGLILFIFIVLANAQTRNFWLNKIKSTCRTSPACST